MEMREMPGYVCYYQRIKISQDRAAFVLKINCIRTQPGLIQFLLMITLVAYW